MRPVLALLFALALISATAPLDLAASRVWTDVAGRTVEAELIRADATTILIRRIDDGREFTLPRDRLSAADLAWLASQAAPPASAQSSAWIKTLNPALKLPLFDAPLLWNEAPADVAARLRLRPESITPGHETWRIYLSLPVTVLGAPAYMLALRSEAGRVTEATVMFTNLPASAMQAVSQGEFWVLNF